MARINIEEEAHKRVSKLAGLANCSDREALGTVSYLWGDSQDILKTHGSRDEIIEWAHLFNLSDEDVEKWILALQKSRFISCLVDGQYLIHGNEVQIENRLSKLARATKGAKATKKKWAEAKRLGAGLKPSSSTPKARDSHAQRGSSQAKPSQAKKEGPEKKELKKAALSNSQLEPSLVALYVTQYKARFSRRPEITGKDQGILLRVQESIGIQRAKDLLEKYLKSKNDWFEKNGFDLATFENKLNAIAAESDGPVKVVL